MTQVIYFSSVSDNTHRFVQRLGAAASRIPLRRTEAALCAEDEYVLITPTYGHGKPKGAVPKQVIQFLNVKENRDLCRGVIAAGNTNFGRGFCLAGDIISAKLQVPYLYRFELMGTSEDIESVREGLEAFWIQQQSQLMTTLATTPIRHAAQGGRTTTITR